MPGTWDFGGAYADTAATLQRSELEQQKMGMAQQAFPSELAHTQSTTRLNNANAASAENALKSRQSMAGLAQGMKVDENKPQSAMLMQLGGAALKAGDTTLGQSLITHAAQVRTAEAREHEYIARAGKMKAELQMKMADRWGNLMNGVKSQEDLDRARFVWQSEFGEEAPAMRYDPDTIRIMQESSVKMRDKVYAEHTKEMEKIARARLGETASYHNQVIDVRRSAEQRRTNADATKAKNGGKDVGAPQKSEVEAASSLLERDGKTKGLDAANSRTASFDLASRARAMRKQNPGLDAGEVLQRALLEQTAEGYFTTQKATSFFGKDKNLYGKPGATAEKALPVPADKSTLKANNYYVTPKGSLLYLGGGKWQAPQAGSKAAPSADENDDEDEE